MRVFREPCYFAEAVYLLYHFMNHISYEEEYKRVSQSFGIPFLEGEDDHIIRDRIRELARISEEMTADLNPMNEQLRYFFERLPGIDQPIRCCLAQVMLMSIPLNLSDTGDFARELVRAYGEMRKVGMKINDINAVGLVIEQQDAQEEPEPLAFQLERLPCTGEAKWQILRALTDFENHVEKLTALIDPIAQRLRTAMEPINRMNEPLLCQWEDYFESHTVDDFQNEMFNTTIACAEANVMHDVWLGLWNFNFLGTWFEWLTGDGALPARVAYIGIGISFEFAARRRKRPDEEALCGMLKALGGKDRLETLRRCVEKPISAARLAAAMNLNSGTVSRNLYSLFKMGFLETKGDGERVNYMTRMDSLQQLFAWILEYVQGECPQ